MPALPRRASARLVERFIFNFRLPPEELDARLPASWLHPQVVNGWAVASFCVLSLRRPTLFGLPPLREYPMVACAYRCGAIDTGGPVPTPTVYITDRNSDRPAIATLGPLLFADTMPTVRAAIARSPGIVEISISYMDGQRLFSAFVHEPARPLALESELFADLREFEGFIAGGVSSWTPSTHTDKLARLDLEKDDVHYQVMTAEVDFADLESLWRDSGLEFDSVVRASGDGKYTWTFRGLRHSHWDPVRRGPSAPGGTPAGLP